MKREYAAALRELSKAGWSVERLSKRRPLPDEILRRYPKIPRDYRELVESTGLVVSPDDTAWLVTGSVFSGTADVAYAWNEWEQQSLEAACNDRALVASVSAFWDRHLPVVMSVKSGYAYFALALETAEVVQGEEPEYEEASILAPSLDEMLRMLVDGDPRIRRWV